MSHEIEHDPGGGILASNLLWICVGLAVFIIIGFILPTPQSVVDTVEKYGFAQKMIEWEVAHDAQGAARKTMIVLGLIPMAVIFFATEAIPIGLTGILMPTMAYFLHLLPRNMIGKTFAGDAPMFLLGVLAMGVAVVDVGLHKRLASWLLGWTKGFMIPVFVLAISMSVVGSFISAHAMCAFMTPVMAAVYFGAVSANSRGGEVQHDPALAKFLLFTLCFALNVGGVGSPAAGGRNVIMMGFWSEYNVPMDFFTWMKYGLPMVPILGVVVAVYMLILFGRKIKTKDLTPGLEAIKDETKRMGKMTYAEYVTFGMLLLILFLWIVGGEELGLGGPSLLALLIPVLFKTTDWKKILGRHILGCLVYVLRGPHLGCPSPTEWRGFMVGSELFEDPQGHWNEPRLGLVDRIIRSVRFDDKFYVGCRDDCAPGSHCDSHGNHDGRRGRALGGGSCCGFCHFLCPLPYCGDPQQCHCLRPRGLSGHRGEDDSPHGFLKIWLRALPSFHGRGLGHRIFGGLQRGGFSRRHSRDGQGGHGRWSTIEEERIRGIKDSRIQVKTTNHNIVDRYRIHHQE
jgi:di/tricarboxylate transporter